MPPPSAAAAESRIDRIVAARWNQLHVQPAGISSDAIFLRRVYLDATGTLPTALEARAFLDDHSPGKRQALVDRLLDRPEFADYWAMKWCDGLRVKAEFPINLWPNATQAYYRWIRASIAENKPYDQFARELLTSSGSNFRVPPVNFYRAVQNREPRGLAQAVALTFMGTRAENWPPERLDAMAAFFSAVGYKSTGEWKEEIVFNTAATRPAATQPTMFPDGTLATVAPGADPREAFADWLIRADNPWFAKNAVNRTWYWLMGRGIIQEPDDIRPDNPPANPELLSYLERELVSHHYDLKHIYRLILNSRTYQLASLGPSGGEVPEGSFAAYPIRRLDAEVLSDALCQISGLPEHYASPIPEPFTFIPDGTRSIALSDASITSTFLDLFGRPSRDTGLESERNNTVTSSQRLHMLNSTHVQRKLEQGPRLQALYQSKKPYSDVVTEMYLAILSRYPTREEQAIAERHRTRSLNRREALIDLAWALVNSSEFLFQH